MFAALTLSGAQVYNLPWLGPDPWRRILRAAMLPARSRTLHRHGRIHRPESEFRHGVGRGRFL